jgi:hypothetical protein
VPVCMDGGVFRPRGPQMRPLPVLTLVRGVVWGVLTFNNV